MNQPIPARTQQQLDESFKESHWHQAIEYGLDTPTVIREYGYKQSYGHSLATAWREFKRRIGDRRSARMTPRLPN